MLTDADQLQLEYAAKTNGAVRKLIQHHEALGELLSDWAFYSERLGIVFKDGESTAWNIINPTLRERIQTMLRSLGKESP